MDRKDLYYREFKGGGAPGTGRILTILNEQGQQTIPFSHTLDLTANEPDLLCLQDLNPQPESASKHASSPNLLKQKAQGLAAIHAAKS